MALCAGGRLNHPPAQMPLCWQARPASTKGHLYWLKVVGGWYARQQKLVLAARTNRFGHSEIKMLMKYL
jgi:hypothetical protein